MNTRIVMRHLEKLKAITAEANHNTLHTVPARTPEVTILLLDYDGCASILFTTFPTDKTKLTIFQTYQQKYQLDLLNVLNKLTTGADRVEVYVASNRQYLLADQHHMREKNNGSCFTNFAKLCHEQGWFFRKLLLADVGHNQLPGTAMYDASLKAKIPKVKENGITKCSKAPIALAQLKDIAKNHPDANVNVFFVDDDSEYYILDEVYHAVKDALPENVNYCTLQYNWGEAYDMNQTENIARIHKDIHHSMNTSLPENTSLFSRILSELSSTGILQTFTPPQKVTVLALDYDDCAEILSLKTEISYSDRTDLDKIIPRIQKCRRDMMEFLDDLTAGSDIVKVYVASMRQDLLSDKETNEAFKNVSCFKSFSTLCHKKKWIFSRFLLPDAQYGLPEGTTMNEERFSAQPIGNTKLPIIQAHFKNIKMHHRHDHVTYYFIDVDSEDIYINEIKEFYKNNKAPLEAYAIKHDWYPEVFEEEATINIRYALSTASNTNNNHQNPILEDLDNTTSSSHTFSSCCVG